MKIHDDAEELKRDIERAFSTVPYPGDENIASDHCPECSEYKAFFRGKHWKSVPELDLPSSSLTFLKGEAFRFYLPAFLTASLHVYDYQDHVSGRAPNVIDSVLFRLERESFDNFDVGQKEVVRRYLEFFRDEAYGGPCERGRPLSEISKALKNLGLKSGEQEEGP